MTGNPETSEFSHIVVPSHVPAAGSAFVLEPTADQRAALAERFGLVSLEAFQAELRLVPVPGGAAVLRLTGTIRARVVQRCVATLAPVEAAIEAPVDITLRPAEQLTGEVDYDQDVEPFRDDKVDIGEIVVEELALTLDPYPWAAGAGEPGGAGPGEGTPNPGPFAALAPLRGKK